VSLVYGREDIAGVSAVLARAKCGLPGTQHSQIAPSPSALRMIEDNSGWPGRHRRARSPNIAGGTLAPAHDPAFARSGREEEVRAYSIVATTPNLLCILAPKGDYRPQATNSKNICACHIGTPP